MMDKQRAIQILCLGHDPSFEEVKSAYRSRTKQFHPDRFSHDDSLKKQAESRMKEINLAFYTLSKLLESDIHVGKSNIKLREFYKNTAIQNRVQGVFSFFRKIFSRNGFKYQTKDQSEDQAVYKNGVKGQGAGIKDNCLTSSHHCGSADRKKIQSFDAVLRKSMKKEPLCGIKEHYAIKRRRLSSLMKNKRLGAGLKFTTYPAARQSMKRKKRFMDTCPGPVERISPVPPVTKIT